MTFEELTQAVQARDRQFEKVANILEAVATSIQAHDRQIAELTIKMAETTGKLDALIAVADGWIRSQPKPGEGRQ